MPASVNLAERLNVDQALNQIASGTLCKQIAAEYGVTPRAIRYHLEKHPEYKSVIAEQAQSFVEDSMSEVFNVEADALLIARARVRVETAFKYAKAHNAAYADKHQIEHTGTIKHDHTLKFDPKTLISNVRMGATLGATADVEDAELVTNQPLTLPVR